MTRRGVYDVIVVGAGLVGGAAARYLAQDGARVAVIGPAEPAAGQAARVYASHYDEGRLARRLSKDETWVRLTQRAMDQYRALEAIAGIEFYRPVGCLHVGPAEGIAANLEQAAALGEAEGIPFTRFAPGDDDWRALAPALDFPATSTVLFEPPPAGVINPREMVRAQLTAARQQGAAVIRATVVDAVEAEKGVTVTTDDGVGYAADRVLVAAGAFANFHNLLPRPLPLRLKTETILLGEVNAQQGAALTELPIVTYQIDDPAIDAIYMTPALPYPDGRWYVKLGCNTQADRGPKTLAEVQAWFRAGDGDACKPVMARALQAMLPAIRFDALRTARCIVCYTPSGLPTIDALSDRIFVAVGGNGAGAKCSDALGALAAGFVMDKRWPDELAREPFRVAGREDSRLKIQD